MTKKQTAKRTAPKSKALAKRPTAAPVRRAPKVTPEQTALAQLPPTMGMAVLGLSRSNFTAEQREQLIAPFPDECIEILPSGEAYVSHIHMRNRLNQIVGPGNWGMMPEDPQVKGDVVVQKWTLMINGVPVASAYGESKYIESNKRHSWGKALESLKSNALMRCCFDSETEVLTDAGFRLFKDVGSARIMQVNGNSLQPVRAAPFSQKYDGPMIRCVAERLDFCVTPDHEMVTTEGKVRAIYLLGRRPSESWRIPRTLVINEERNRPGRQALMRLIGFLLADGTRVNGNTWIISVSRQRKIDELRALNLHRREAVHRVAGDVATAKGGHVFKTKSDRIKFSYDASLVDAWFDKKKKALLPSSVVEFSGRDARDIVEAWSSFDGHLVTADLCRAYCSSLEILGQMEVLAVKGGLTISKRSSRILPTVSERPNYSITLSAANEVALWTSMSVEPNASKLVWCVTVPSGVIIVRRHGFSMLCGNCKDLGFAAIFWDRRQQYQYRLRHGVYVRVKNYRGEIDSQWRHVDGPPYPGEIGLDDRSPNADRYKPPTSARKQAAVAYTPRTDADEDAAAAVDLRANAESAMVPVNDAPIGQEARKQIFAALKTHAMTEDAFKAFLKKQWGYTSTNQILKSQLRVVLDYVRSPYDV